MRRLGCLRENFVLAICGGLRGLRVRFGLGDVLIDRVQCLLRDGTGHGHGDDGRPSGAVACMVHGAERVAVLAADSQAGDDIIALTGLRRADDLHSGSRGTLADLDMVEVRLHLRAGSGLAVPMDGHHA